MWALTAIDPEKKAAIETRTFTDPDKASTWIDKYNGKRNLYFHVNQPRQLLTKKATKADIGAAYYLHVDVDPRAGEPLDAERQRIRRMVVDEEGWPTDLPRPQLVIDSGGGYQCFWRLDAAFQIGGDVGLAEDFERYNRAIEQALDGDNCHNVDRIMRLPGTWNLPDATKRKKGRVPALADVVTQADSSIPLDAITPVPKQQADPGAARRVAVSGNVERYADLSFLDEWDVPEYIRVVIAQGSLPPEDCDEKQARFTRSDWLFKVLCEFARRDVPDDVAFSIITDPDWAISEHVFAQKVSADKYAIRQIERAKDYAIDPALAEFNQRYTVIRNFGGKCYVIEELFDPVLHRHQLSKITPPQLREMWCNRLVQVGQKSDGTPLYKPAGKWWLEHPLRNEFESITFAPGQEVAGAFNLWRGFGVAPREGECDLFLAHLRDNICGGNDIHYRYLLGWMARAVQKPDRPGEVAVVMRGDRGTGKSVFANAFGKLFGRHFHKVLDAKHLVGAFNSHLRDCVVLFADEAFYAGDRKHEGVLKGLVTEPIIQYEAKGVDAEQGPNFIHLIMASNSDWVVPAGPHERRFFVLEVSDAHRQDKAYFRAMHEQLDDGGYEALLAMLLAYDLHGFEVRDVPKTRLLQTQADITREPYVDAFIECVEFGNCPSDLLAEYGPDYISVQGVLDRLPVGAENERGLRTRIGILLGRFAETNKDGKPLTRNADRWLRDQYGKAVRYRRKLYKMRPRSECCAELVATFGVDFEHPDHSWTSGEDDGPGEDPGHVSSGESNGFPF